MIDILKDKLKSLALSDAILEPEWEYRYFSYDSNWGDSEEMASMRDGQGGHWFVLFENDQVAYKCISPADGLIDNYESIKETIPLSFSNFINEPAFYVDDASAIWLNEGKEWRKLGKKIKYLIDLDKVLEWKVSDYKAWAEDYYEREIDLESLEQIFRKDISESTIRKLNPDLSLKELSGDLREIGIEL